jgi:hypothetical protein
VYLNPPAHAAVFSGDEKTAIQALDRKDPLLPLSPGASNGTVWSAFRHGTLSPYAAFNTKTGEVLGKTAARHTPAGFVAFVTDIVIDQPPRQRDPCDSRQPLSSQEQGGHGLPGGVSQSSLALHSDLLFVAESGRAVAPQHRARWQPLAAGRGRLPRRDKRSLFVGELEGALDYVRGDLAAPNLSDFYAVARANHTNRHDRFARKTSRPDRDVHTQPCRMDESGTDHRRDRTDAAPAHLQRGVFRLFAKCTGR